MPSIAVREGDSLEAVNRKFKKMCEFVLSEVNKRRAFEKRSVRRKKKAIAARKRYLKKSKKFYRF